MDKDEALEIVSENGNEISTLEPELQKDYDIITTAIKQSYLSLIEIPIENITNDILAFIFNNEYQEYYDEILYIIENYKNKNILENTNDILKRNKILIEILLVLNAKTMKYAPKEFLCDRNFIFSILKKYNGDHGKILKYVSNDIKNDKEIVYLIIENEIYSEYTHSLFKYASDEIKDNYDFIYNAVEKTTIFLEYVSDRIKDDYNIISKAVNYYGIAIKYASQNLRNNFNIVFNAVKNQGYVLRYVSDELKNNKKIVLAAIRNNESAFQFMSNELKDDEHIILKTLKYKNVYFLNLLNYVSPRLRDNEKVITTYVKKKYYVFDNASIRLKTNKKFILYLLKIDINIIQYVDNILLDDDDIGTFVINNNINKINYLSERLQYKILLNIDEKNIIILLFNNKEYILNIYINNNKLYNNFIDKIKNDNKLLICILENRPNFLSEPYIKITYDNKFVFTIIKLNLFVHLPDKVKKKYAIVQRILNYNETNINKILDAFFNNIDIFIDNEYILNLIFRENLQIFKNIWYNSKSIRNKLLPNIEDNEKFSIILNDYNIVFENIKIFDETLDISNIDDPRFINIQKINESNMKKQIIYY